MPVTAHRPVSTGFLAIHSVMARLYMSLNGRRLSTALMDAMAVVINKAVGMNGNLQAAGQTYTRPPFSDAFDSVLGALSKESSEVYRLYLHKTLKASWSVLFAEQGSRPHSGKGKCSTSSQTLNSTNFPSPDERGMTGWLEHHGC